MSNESQAHWEKGRNDSLQNKGLDPNVANLSATLREKEVAGFHAGEKEKEKPSS